MYVSTTPLWQWGFLQCLPFSWIKLRDKHCWYPIAVMGVVDSFGPVIIQVFSLVKITAFILRDANSPAIFIPWGFGESGIAFFHSSGIRGSKNYSSGSLGKFREIKSPKMSHP